MTKIVSSVKRHPWWLGIGLLVIGGGVWASWDVLSLALTDPFSLGERVW